MVLLNCLSLPRENVIFCFRKFEFFMQLSFKLSKFFFDVGFRLVSGLNLASPQLNVLLWVYGRRVDLRIVDCVALHAVARGRGCVLLARMDEVVLLVKVPLIKVKIFLLAG